MTVPSRFILVAGITLSLMLVAVVVEPMVGLAVLSADILLVLLCLYDGQKLKKQSVIVERDHWMRFQINHTCEFPFRISNRGNRMVRVLVRQPMPPSIETDLDYVEVPIEPGESICVALEATPHRRGRISLPPVEIDVRFPFGWARRRWNLDEGGTISVYLDLQKLYEFDTMRRHRALSQFGIHRKRMIGAGREFEQLREYLPDDDYRDINWKATARRRRPVTNVYQAERSQDVLICLDCGRMMGNPIENGTALDRAIDASIMLAHVSNRQGDRVGLVLFKDTVNLFLKPKTGPKSVNRIIEELVDVVPEGVFPSYSALVGSLRVHHKRRSMIFLFTDLNDPQLAADLVEVLPLISKRHLVVVISLRDALLDKVADGPADNRQQAYQVLAARELAMERQGRSRELRQAGVQVLEADAQNISLQVINNYLEIKSRQLL